MRENRKRFALKLCQYLLSSSTQIFGKQRKSFSISWYQILCYSVFFTACPFGFHFHVHIYPFSMHFCLFLLDFETKLHLIIFLNLSHSHNLISNLILDGDFALKNVFMTKMNHFLERPEKNWWMFYQRNIVRINWLWMGLLNIDINLKFCALDSTILTISEFTWKTLKDFISTCLSTTPNIRYL